MKLNKEALLEVSLKNLHPFQSYHFSKTPLFQNGPKNLSEVEKLSFFGFHGNHFIGLFNGILHVLIF